MSKKKFLGANLCNNVKVSPCISSTQILQEMHGYELRSLTNSNLCLKMIKDSKKESQL